MQNFFTISNLYDMVRRVSIPIIFRLFWRQIRLHRGLLFRALLCWGIGCLVLASDELQSYDTRLRIRGDQMASSDLILIVFKTSDLKRPLKEQIYNEHSENYDSSFWEPQLWQDLFKKILAQNPGKIAVTLALRENLWPKPSQDHMSLFHDPRIVWAALGSDEQSFHSPFENNQKTNIGAIETLRDEDGSIRRFYSPTPEFPHLTEKLTGVTLSSGRTPRTINFRGSARVFNQYSVSDVLSGRVPSEAFKNKLVLIGAEGVTTSQYQTPVGNLSRTLLFANIADNLLEDRWISRGSMWMYVPYLLLIVAISAFFVTRYPQSISALFLIWLMLLTGALSVWIFDSKYFWLPFFSIVATIFTTWMIFIGNLANRMEQKSWLLEQEKKYLAELEQLKNNFVSLISHDLKTPLAKIQSITDRLLLQSHEPQQDLLNLRASSDELNKYIRSIIKLLRVESRDLKIQSEVFDINDLIHEVQTTLAPLAAEKNIRLALELETLFSIEADPILIREVLLNLIENAIKYSSPDKTVRIRSQEIRDSVQVDVVDEGPGIPPGEQDAVWNRFVRGKSEELKSKGSGLGLYLVKYFIELHGGTVELESELQKGTRVSFTLPFEFESHTFSQTEAS